MSEVAYGTPARPAWHSEEPIPRRRSHHTKGEYVRSKHEWMPRPFGGRTMVTSRKASGDPIFLQVVPGPERTWQIVRVELGSPVARGFRTPEQARKWVARAVRQGVLPEGVTVVEPPPTT